MIESVSFAVDQFIADKNEAIWVVKLSNGLVVYGDDGRPGLHPNSWIRLKKFVFHENLHITELNLRFRSHMELACPRNAAGYYFGHSAAYYNGANISCCLCGYFNHIADTTLHISKWQVPELIFLKEERRELNLSHQLLIINGRTS